MKKILLLSVMSLLAFSMTACKGDKYEPKDDQEQTKDDGIYVSEEDANWVNKCTPYPVKVPNFIMGYFVPADDKIYYSVSGVDRYFEHVHTVYNLATITTYANGPVAIYHDHDVKDLTFLAGPINEFKLIVPAYHYNKPPEGSFTNRVVDEPLYNSLSQKYNDTRYYDRYPTVVLAKAVDYLNVTCTSDYDENHKAGDLLNDIIRVEFYSAKPFLDTKYKNKRYGDATTVFKSSLEEFNDADWPLLSGGVRFYLANNPAKAGIYKFTITFCDEDGDVRSGTTYPIKLKAR